MVMQLAGKLKIIRPTCEMLIVKLKLLKLTHLADASFCILKVQHPRARLTSGRQVFLIRCQVKTKLGRKREGEASFSNSSTNSATLSPV